MSRLIDSLKYDVTRFTENDNVRKVTDALFGLLEEENKARGNYEAFINVGSIDEETRDLPDEGYGDTWNVLTGSFRYDDADGHEEVRECHINSYEDIKQELEDETESRMSALQDSIAELEEAIEEGEGTEVERKVWQENLDEYSAKLSKLEDSLISIQRSDFEYDEIYWNTLYQYNGGVDADAAEACGLAIVEVEGEEYMGLTGCGMDLSPKFFCYQALAHGYVDEKWSGKIRSLGPSYFRSVVGAETFKRATDELGITEFMDAAEDELNKRMKRFDDSIRSISKNIEDPTLRGIAALLALHNSK